MGIAITTLKENQKKHFDRSQSLVETTDTDVEKFQKENFIVLSFS